MSISYTADFETTTDKDDCRVWSYGISKIGDPDNFTYGNDIKDFIKFCEKSNNSTFYFHNLKFDGVFIICELFKQGFNHVEDRKDLASKTFTTLISDKGQYYSLKIVFYKQGKKTTYVNILDSYKIIPLSVEAIAKGFDLTYKKIIKDSDFYSRFRGVNHSITEEELEYLEMDVKVMSASLQVLFDQQLEKSTLGNNAIGDYKRTIGDKRFEQWFPTPKYDGDIRPSYKGGFTYLNPKYKNVDVGKGLVFDVNSLYPSVMRFKPLPYGEGIYFEGKYVQDSLYNLHVQMFTCQFEIKDDHIPTVQLKNNLSFIPTQYLSSSEGEEVTMCMTSVDLDLFFAHYDVYNIVWHSGWKFKSSTGLFVDYIDKWSEIKIQSKRTGNKAMYLIAKLMLNNLYGKFATNPNVQSKIPYHQDGIVKYILGEKGTKAPIYIPVGTFVTAWARHKTITAAQSVFERFIYADTDSLHLEGTDIPVGLEIDDDKLGCWSQDATFMRGKFLRAKSYFEVEIISDKAYNKMEEEEKEKCYFYEGVRVKDHITCAGMPDRCKELVTWENFTIGSVFEGKLQPVHVKGGIILEEREFTIKQM